MLMAMLWGAVSFGLIKVAPDQYSPSPNAGMWRFLALAFAVFFAIAAILSGAFDVIGRFKAPVVHVQPFRVY